MNVPDDILSDSELLRYSRQISIKAMDIDGQEHLKQAKVLMIGAGGLGCAASQYLTVAGIGELTLVDFDHVDSLTCSAKCCIKMPMSASQKSNRPNRA